MLFSWNERKEYASYMTQEVMRQLRNKGVFSDREDVIVETVNEAIRNVILDVREGS